MNLMGSSINVGTTFASKIVASSSLVTHMINIAGWDWDEYLQHLVDIGIERKRWREYMIEELYPLPGNQIVRLSNVCPT